MLLFFAPFPAEAFHYVYQDSESGVKIICGTEPGMFPVSWRGGRIRGQATALDRSVALQKLALLKKELKKYPAVFLRKYLKRVYILRKMRFYGMSFGGTYFASTRTVYIISSSPNYFKQLFHAEFSSIIYKENQESFPVSSWKRANAPGFSYGRGGRNALKTGGSSTRFAPVYHKKGLLYQYGSASVEEDFNSYARNIFAAKKGFWKAVSEYPGLTRKVALICRFYGTLHPRFHLKYFRSLSSDAARYTIKDSGSTNTNTITDRNTPNDDQPHSGFQGEWKTTFGKMSLTVSGNRITGSYGSSDGRLHGTLHGRRLEFSWSEKNGQSVGKGVFILSKDGTRFSGTWGYRTSATSGGRWTGVRMRE